MYKAIFFVIFFIVADSQEYEYIDEDDESSGDFINTRLPIDEDSRQTFSFALDIQSILYSLKKIGFGLGVTFGRANWNNELISKQVQNMGIGLDMYFRDCTKGDVTTDYLLIQTLRILFNGSSRIQFAVQHGLFFRNFGLVKYKIPTRDGKYYRVIKLISDKDFVLGEGFGKGSVAGGGIGVVHGKGHIEADGSVTTTGAAFGIGLGNAQGLGKGPVINVLSDFLKRFVRYARW